MRTRATITLAAALLALTGCTSSSDDKPATAEDRSARPTATAAATPDGEAAELEQAVRDYTDAYFAGDAAAYDTLSERCQDKVTPEAYEAVVKQAATDYGKDHPATDVQADVSGDLARVSYKVQGLPKFDQKQQPWTREDGAWRYDAC